MVSGNIVLMNKLAGVTIEVYGALPPAAIAITAQSTGAYAVLDSARAMDPHMTTKFSLLELGGGGFILGCPIPVGEGRFDVVLASGDALMHAVEISRATPVLSFVFEPVPEEA